MGFSTFLPAAYGVHSPAPSPPAQAGIVPFCCFILTDTAERRGYSHPEGSGPMAFGIEPPLPEMHPRAGGCAYRGSIPRTPGASSRCYSPESSNGRTPASQAGSAGSIPVSGSSSCSGSPHREGYPGSFGAVRVLVFVVFPVRLGARRSAAPPPAFAGILISSVSDFKTAACRERHPGTIAQIVTVPPSPRHGMPEGAGSHYGAGSIPA